MRSLLEHIEDMEEGEYMLIVIIPRNVEKGKDFVHSRNGHTNAIYEKMGVY